MPPFEPEPLPPKDLDLLALMAIVGKANRGIATFEGLLYGIPNPDILLSPLTTREAVLSSRIEGTQADFEEVLKSEAGQPPEEPSRQEDVREIVNYRKALHLSIQLLKRRPFCLNTLLKLHDVLMDSVRGHNKGRGRFRTTQNWIGKEGSPIEDAVFVPPSPLYLQEHLNRWEAYWHADAPDALIQLAIIHGQFEILHPFLDGNGRIGRMVIPLFLFEKNILSRPCFYLSEYFEAHRQQYIAQLRDLGRPGGWTQWCAFFLEGIATQATANTSRARAIQDLYARLKNRIIELTNSQFAVPLLDFMFERPIFPASDVTKLDHMPSPPMVASLLGKLKRNGVLNTVRKSAGRRPEILALSELINLCEGRKVM